MSIDTADHMKKDRDGEPYYDGPSEWVEGETTLLACAITWDDQWLTKDEITRMMTRIADLPEARDQGVVWQALRVRWRDDIQHFVLEAPLYKR